MLCSTSTLPLIQSILSHAATVSLSNMSYRSLLSSKAVEAQVLTMTHETRQNPHPAPIHYISNLTPTALPSALTSFQLPGLPATPPTPGPLCLPLPLSGPSFQPIFAKLPPSPTSRSYPNATFSPARWPIPFQVFILLHSTQRHLIYYMFYIFIMLTTCLHM